jgi:ferredoxin
MAKVSAYEWEKEIPGRFTLTEVKKDDPTFPVAFSCRAGFCGLCAVEIREGAENVSKPTLIETETLKRVWQGRNYRLACQCSVSGSIVLDPIYKPFEPVQN